MSLPELKSRCQQLIPSGGSREESTPCFFQLLAVSEFRGIPRLMASSWQLLVSSPHCLLLFCSQVPLCLLHVRKHVRTSLVAQWLRFHLPAQGVWVQSLVRELRPHVPQGQKAKIEKKRKQYGNKFNKDFKKRKKKACDYAGATKTIQDNLFMSTSLI